MRRFRMLAEAAGATEILACATSALRSASNGDAVLDRIEAEAGVAADVIDGLEEARLIFTAIRTAVLIDPGPALCFDLGGGSVEIMVGDSTGLQWAASERLGVARLSAAVRELGSRSRRVTAAACVSTSSTSSARSPSRSCGSSPRWRSGAAARSRTSPRWSRRGATSRSRARSTS